MTKSWKSLGQWIIATPRHFAAALAIILLIAVTGVVSFMIHAIWTHIIGPIAVFGCLLLIGASLWSGIKPGKSSKSK